MTTIKIGRLVVIVSLLATLAGRLTIPVYATSYHEDPDAAKPVYNGISLLQYYSDSLDLILQKNPDETATLLDKMPFTNIPPALDQPTREFAASGILFSVSLSDLFLIWQQENSLIAEYRLDDAAGLGQQIAVGLPQARNQLAKLKKSVQDTGTYLKISTLSPSNQLFRNYQEIMDKVLQLEKMLDLLSRPLLDIEKLTGLLQSTHPDLLQEIIDSGDADLLKLLLEPTILTLELNPQSAFVGDEIGFYGLLSSQGKPLAERNIDILLDNARYLTVKTDTLGSFGGKLQVPYEYRPKLDVQVIYYPQTTDVGVYLGTVSPLVKANVLYYEANLALQIKGLAYPGKEVLLTGKYDYAQSPAPEERQSSIYLDDEMVEGLTGGVDFSKIISLDPAIAPGKHSVTVSAPAQGRYSPVVGSCTLDVAQAATGLDLNTPRLAFIPGGIRIKGQLHSELGPLRNASITIEINGTLTRLKTAADGSFTQQIKMGIGLSFLGAQNIYIRIQPEEPWNAPLSLTRSVFVVNYISCGLLLFVLLALGVYLPRRFQKGYAVYPKRVKELPQIPSPALITRNQSAVSVNNEVFIDRTESTNPVFVGYRLAIKLIQSLTRVILQPQQTLREYALENSLKLGSLGKYFLEFTSLIERLLYSSHKATGEDIENSRRLTEAIKEKAKIENI